MYAAIQTISKKIHDLKDISYLDLLKPTFERQGLDVKDAEIRKYWSVMVETESGGMLELPSDEENATHVTISFRWDELHS
jgi:hypothetical protein